MTKKTTRKKKKDEQPPVEEIQPTAEDSVSEDSTSSEDTALIIEAVAGLYNQAGGMVEEDHRAEDESQEEFLAEEGYGETEATQSGDEPQQQGRVFEIEALQFTPVETQESEENDSSDETDEFLENPPNSESATEEEASGGAQVAEVVFQQPEPEDETPEVVPSEVEEETAAIEGIGEDENLKTPADIKAALECLFFTTTHPLGLARMRSILGKIDMKTLRGLVLQLQAEYEARGSGLQILESSEGFQMCTRPRHADVILRLHRQRKKNPLSMTALETLAIIAYKQPITRAEIEMIRGVESSGVLRNLSDMGMVKVVGRKEVIGRPQLYGTTNVFLTTFGLKSTQDLPPINELRKRYSGSSIFAAPPPEEESASEESAVNDLNEAAVADDEAQTSASSEAEVGSVSAPETTGEDSTAAEVAAPSEAGIAEDGSESADVTDMPADDSEPTDEAPAMDAPEDNTKSSESVVAEDDNEPQDSGDEDSSEKESIDE